MQRQRSSLRKVPSQESPEKAQDARQALLTDKSHPEHRNGRLRPSYAIAAMTLPLSARASRQCSVILTDDDLDALDTLSAVLGVSRSELMRSFIRMGVDLMTDPVNALPALLDGVIANLEAHGDEAA